ncbi:zinc-binding dehydrogenase [Streptomyces marincola]|uniref:Oxidoreductase n=1 Tax=Streptomyces marincola TaxID=2878388 RepID=A0A1W7CZ42_9ACTN|nr:zinc-binding dehydrogenase [Streptomyces marincola]ARQ70064.1 oxidoreductase [Streptomyces marincola]
MHAIRLHAFGPPENLLPVDLPEPEPAPGQVRIAVAAAGVHVVDTVLRAGGTRGPFPLPELPTVPGREVAGTVDATGEGVPADWLGRRVVAHLGAVPGGYAERAVTTPDRLHVLPDGLPADRAVAMIGTGRTAMGILRFADPGPGDTVLVLAAAGGIGSLLVQHAKRRGATVVGAAGGPAKTRVVRGLGADLAVDYRETGWTDRIRSAFGALSHVFEGVGGATADSAVRLLGPGGLHLVYGWFSDAADRQDAGRVTAELRERGGESITVVGPPMLERIGGPGSLRVLEEEALAHAGAGRLVPLVQRFPLAEAAAAHRALEARTTIGKVVLVP